MITADEIIALDPCSNWPHDTIRTRVGAGVTYNQIAEDDSVSLADRRWVLTQLGVRTPGGLRAVRLWACECAQDAAVTLPDGDAKDAALGAISEALDLIEGAGDVERCRTAAAAAYAYAAYAAAHAAYAAAHAYSAYSADAADAAASAYAAYAADAADAAASAAHAAASQHLLNLATRLEAL